MRCIAQLLRDPEIISKHITSDIIIINKLKSPYRLANNKMSRKNTIIYVGGLEAQVTEEILHSAFIPFGELKSVQIPKDYAESNY